MPLENPDRTLLNTHEPMRTVTKRRNAPDLVFRMCRTPDSKRVVGAWMFYEDVNRQYPEDKGWDTPSTPNPPAYAIRPILGKGQGMIATRNIRRGEIIILERPIIILPIDMTTTQDDAWASQEKTLLQLLYFLEPEDRAKVLQLTNCKPLNDMYGPLNGLFCTNAVGIYFPASQSLYCNEYAALCLDISRANHSCAPNAAYADDPKTFVFTLYALRDIPANEEITITYMSEFVPYAKRQKMLLEKYFFRCTCPACSAPQSIILESDKRRQYIESILQSTGSMAKTWMETKGAHARRDIETLLSVIHAMDEEGLYYNRERLTEFLAHLYAGLGDRKNFTKWGNETVKIYELKKVEDAEMWREWLNLENPVYMSLWGAWGAGL